MKKLLGATIISAGLIGCGSPDNGNDFKSILKQSNYETPITTMNKNLQDKVCDILSCKFTNEYTIELSNLIISNGIILTDSLIKNLYKIDLIVSDFNSGIYDGFLGKKIEDMMRPGGLGISVASILYSNNPDINSINDILVSQIDNLDELDKSFKKYVDILDAIDAYEKNREKYTYDDGYTEGYFYSDDYLDFLRSKASSILNNDPKTLLDIEEIDNLEQYYYSNEFSGHFEGKLYTTKKLW